MKLVQDRQILAHLLEVGKLLDRHGGYKFGNAPPDEDEPR